MKRKYVRGTVKRNKTERLQRHRENKKQEEKRQGNRTDELCELFHK